MKFFDTHSVSLSKECLISRSIWDGIMSTALVVLQAQYQYGGPDGPCGPEWSGGPGGRDDLAGPDGPGYPEWSGGPAGLDGIGCPE